MTMGATKSLRIDTAAESVEDSDGTTGRGEMSGTPDTVPTTPLISQTDTEIKRGPDDIRSPGIPKTPTIADFITQTDRFGNATTPRTQATNQTPQKNSTLSEAGSQPTTLIGHQEEDNSHEDDVCDTLLDNFRMMCCCFLLPDQQTQTNNYSKPSSHSLSTPTNTAANLTIASSSTQTESPEIIKERSLMQLQKILPPIHPDDVGKKCLVLDLDETLVHSSFRAVPGADFVIPVQMEDVVHFVYVAKRPGVDEFLLEMAKHYEIVVYTASLDKYADPLLDLLDPHRVIRTRLFRESCVFFEGNYIKDLSQLDRDLSQCIIIDNSASSYLFHPENAIDCSSFIDDRNDRELDHIGAFLVGIKDSKDVRGLAPKWRRFPKPHKKLSGGD